MTFTPQDFVSKWKRVTSREKQTYQEHFIDLCHLVDHPTPNEADPTGTRFAFEMGAARTSGGQGWADIAKLGYFGCEYKDKDHDLDKAYEQLLRYRSVKQKVVFVIPLRQPSKPSLSPGLRAQSHKMIREFRPLPGRRRNWSSSATGG